MPNIYYLSYLTYLISYREIVTFNNKWNGEQSIGFKVRNNGLKFQLPDYLALWPWRSCCFLSCSNIWLSEYLLHCISIKEASLEPEALEASLKGNYRHSLISHWSQYCQPTYLGKSIKTFIITIIHLNWKCIKIDPYWTKM